MYRHLEAKFWRFFKKIFIFFKNYLHICKKNCTFADSKNLGMKTAFQQFENDYAKVMHGYGKKILFQGGNSINPYVYFEEFSIFDKSLQSKSATSSI